MMQPMDNEDTLTFSGAVTSEFEPAATADSQCDQKPSVHGTSSRKYQITEQTAAQSPPPDSKATGFADITKSDNGSDSDSDEFHDSESDVGANVNYTVVKKSVFKEPKRGSGLLSRLKDASSRASVRSKYLPTIAVHEDIEKEAAMVTPQARRRKSIDDPPPQIVISAFNPSDENNEVQDAQPSIPAAADAYEDDGSGITVAIDNAAAVKEAAAAETLALAALVVEDATEAHAILQREEEGEGFGAGPQVVIHSGESDSDSTTGFVTLNPVINSSIKSSKRYLKATTISLASVTSGPGSASSTSTTSILPGSGASPCLQEIPALVTSSDSMLRDQHHPFLLVISALGASGLAKVEKFGTQSTFLEMRIVSNGSDSDSDELSGSGSAMKTALHKKSGSDAQWNQQFSAPLRSKHAQSLHISVKTHSKVAIGEARVPLTSVGDEGLFYDQHYPIFRSMTTIGTATANDMGDSDEVVSGSVHLQLKIVDAASVTTGSAAVVPPLQLPVHSLDGHHQYQQPVREIPPALRNGALLFKVPYHSRSIGSAAIRRQWVMVYSPISSTASSFEITWCDPTASATDQKSARSLDLNLVTEVREGHRTKAFERQLQTASSSSVVRERDKCFSLVTKARTLDLVASCKEEARVWVSALRELLFFQSSDGDDSSARVMEDYKTSALSPRGSAVLHDLGSKPQFYATASNSNSKTKLVVWRNSVFDLARKNRIQEIAACLHDGCPIDLLEPGDGDTILMIACRLGHVQLVELCLSWRAKNDPHPEFGETALQAAVNSSHAKCVTLLLSTAAKSDMDSEIVNHIDSNNDAPLHVTARHGDLACLQLLLHHGADICVVEEFGRTPLHCAVANGHLDCVAYLLDVGGDSVLNAGDHDGDTALHYAALAGNEAIVKLLLESAANVFSANIHNETPYDIALREKQQQCAFLISQYYLTNTKEPSSVILTSPASRNEAASTLLLRQRKQQCDDDDIENDDGEDYDRECASDSDASTAYAASLSPQHSFYDERPHHLVSAAAAPPKYTDDHHNVDDEDYGVAYTESNHHYDRHQQHRYPVASPGMHALLATSRVPLSPSDQVREALLQNQSLHRNSPPNPDLRYRSHSHHNPHRLNTPAVPPLSSQERAHFGSARIAPHHHQFASRGALSERIDRDHHHNHSSSPQFPYAIQGGAAQQYESIAADEEYYRQVSRYSDHPYDHTAATGRNRSHSDEMRYSHHQYYQQQQHDDERTRWNENDSALRHHQYSQGGRRSNSMDLTMSSHNRLNQPNLQVRAGWERPSPSPRYQSNSTVPTHQYQDSPVPPATAAAAVAVNSLWDTFYTQDGYPYYVHRVTGVSQWEKPSVPVPSSPSPALSTVFTHPSRSTHGAALDTTMSPDSIIRMRLAEARNQKSSSSSNLNTPGAALSPVPLGVPEPVLITTQAPATVQHGSPSPPLSDSQLPSSAKSNTVTNESGSNARIQENQGSKDRAVPAVQVATASMVSPPASPTRESKFQERTGLKLSVDISSPTRQDETRPVFVPPPRSKSPKKNPKDPLDSPIREFEGSFQKSRPSSPRGKSKNIQLIELKRANNLAIALASFKIHENYGQVISNIVTMNEKTISAELLACLQRFFPTEDERQQLQAFEGPISRLGKAEQFFFQMLQVPQMQGRIDMFLYKLEFPRTYRSLLSKIQIVKCACRDLVENFSFLRVLQEFYDKQTARKCFQVFSDQRQVFKSDFLPQVDEKLRSFRDDLVKAMGIELMDLQIQFNRLTAGIRPIHAFLEKNHDSPSKDGSSAMDERDLAANGVLQLFAVETRAALSEIESEYESMGVWEDKLLTVFGESRASCQLSVILHCVVEIL